MNLPVDYDKLKPEERRSVRLQYIELQKGLCYFCKESLEGPPKKEIADKSIHPHLYPKGFFGNPVHLHHNHNTGMTIGAVHSHCNAVLYEYYGE